MGVLNIFKKKKIEEKKVEKKKVEKSVAPVVKEEKVGTKGKVVLEGASSVLLINPYLSEKSTILRSKKINIFLKLIRERQKMK